VKETEFIFGWLDINHIQHVERLNELSSIFVTHVDLLDDLE
jgi:adenylosuccinate synthase